MTFVSHSEGILFSLNIQLKRLVIVSKPVSPKANNISVTKPDVSEVLPFFILVNADFTLSVSICGWGPITGSCKTKFFCPRGTLR